MTELTVPGRRRKERELRRLLKIVPGVVLAAAIGWSVWWYLAAEAQERGLAAWLASQQVRGWQAEAAAIEVSGFPTDFTLHVAGLALADPENGWAWEAPALTATSAAWAPTRVAVDWPPEQVVAVPGERATVRTALMDTLMDLRPGPALELREATTSLAELAIVSTAGWTAGADAAEVRLAERPEELAPPNSYDIRLTADGVVLPEALVGRIDPTGWLKPRVDRVTVIGHAALAEPLGLATVEDGEVALRAASLREVGFEWGEMRLVVSGSFIVDEQGYPDGSIEVEAREWRQMVRLAVSSGVIGEDTARAVERAIEFVTALTGGGDTLSAPLNLSGGKLRIGPFAVADVPRLAPPRG